MGTAEPAGLLSHPSAGTAQAQGVSVLHRNIRGAPHTAEERQGLILVLEATKVSQCRAQPTNY